MYTFNHCFNLLTDHQKEAFNNEFMKSNGTDVKLSEFYNKKFNSFKNFLEDSFLWSDTEQGFKFWLDISNQHGHNMQYVYVFYKGDGTEKLITAPDDESAISKCKELKQGEYSSLFKTSFLTPITGSVIFRYIPIFNNNLLLSPEEEPLDESYKALH